MNGSIDTDKFLASSARHRMKNDQYRRRALASFIVSNVQAAMAMRAVMRAVDDAGPTEEAMEMLAHLERQITSDCLVKLGVDLGEER